MTYEIFGEGGFSPKYKRTRKMGLQLREGALTYITRIDIQVLFKHIFNVGGQPHFYQVLALNSCVGLNSFAEFS